MGALLAEPDTGQAGGMSGGAAAESVDFGSTVVLAEAFFGGAVQLDTTVTFAPTAVAELPAALLPDALEAVTAPQIDANEAAAVMLAAQQLEQQFSATEGLGDPMLLNATLADRYGIDATAPDVAGPGTMSAGAGAGSGAGAAGGGAGGGGGGGG